MKKTCPLLPTGIAAVLSIYEDEYLTGTRSKRVYLHLQERSCCSDTRVDKRRIAPYLVEIQEKLKLTLKLSCDKMYGGAGWR